MIPQWVWDELNYLHALDPEPGQYVTPWGQCCFERMAQLADYVEEMGYR